nr:Nucleoporin nup84 [Polyrhizophydium stewartii]
MSGIPRPAFADQEIGLPLPHFDQRPEDIFNALTHSDDPRINKESTEAFHVIQAHVILDSIDRLFDDLKTQLVRIESGAASVPRIEHLPQVLRFSAHLVRLMCDLGYSELSDGAEFVVGRYIHLLQVGQKDSFEVRRELTVAGGECSLDMVRICLVTVDKIFRRSSIRDMLQESVPPVQLCMTTDQVPESDDVLVRALEWLDMDHSQTEDKFDHANFLLRRFLIQGHVQSAKHLRNELGISDETLRDMVGREGDAVTMAREWTLWATLVDCIESFATWTRTFFQERPKPDRRSQRESEWANKVRTVSGAALGRMKLVLQVFMAPDYLAPTHSVAEQRELELELVRSIYVPEIVMWMHQILLQTHTIVPGNLEESLKLANVVAGSAGSDMYEQFKRSNKLGLFMRAMRESALAMLEAGHRIFDR